jgi:hypothetical protein
MARIINTGAGLVVRSFFFFFLYYHFLNIFVSKKNPKFPLELEIEINKKKVLSIIVF